jgi:hypothetical protein
MICTFTKSGRLLYGEPDAVSNAVNYARFYSCSHDAVIRMYDDAGWQGDRDAQAGEAIFASSDSRLRGGQELNGD